MIKAITFDLDGVYFLKGKENFIKNLGEKYGISEDEAKRVFLKSEQMNILYKTGKMNDGEFWNWAASEWKIEAKPAELIDLLISGYEVNEYVAEIVRRVRNNGYKTLICSSNFPARINGLHKRFGFLDNFDAFALSYEIGINKPEKGLYEELVKKSGVAANEIALADDYEPSVAAAKEVGICAFVYKDFEQFLEELNKMGVKI
ncbi:MAG: HAD family hydrolase [Microgenomates group bacterium]